MFKVYTFLAVVTVANAATFIGLLPEQPEGYPYTEGCYVREINAILPFGMEVKPIGLCARISCRRHVIDYATCGVVGAGENCYVTNGDITKQYPDCCPGVKCESDNFVEW